MKSFKEYCIEREGDYFEARAEAFQEFITSHIKVMQKNSEPTIENTIVYLKMQEEFIFPKKDEWLTQRYESMLGDYIDRLREAKYDID